MIKNAPFGARFLMKSGSGNEEIVTGAQITQGEGYANAQAFAGVAETGGICRIAKQSGQASPRRGDMPDCVSMKTGRREGEPLPYITPSTALRSPFLKEEG